ncbi:MAG: putative collagen-binding domain-containing protein [Thermoguttaceae bacterium]
MILRTFVACIVSVASGVAGAVAAETTAAGGIAVYSGNPFYWQYRGKPVLLLGGSTAPTVQSNDEGMFHWPDAVEALERLRAAGGNYVRCLMSADLRGEPVWPFAKKAQQYDLDQWNEEYWRRFNMFLQETQAGNIIVSVELWATFDYYRENWERNPFNPKNNINYTAAESGLPLAVPSHPARAENDFFRAIPGAKNMPVVLKYQQRFVDKVLSYTLTYEHVLYVMDNETAVTPKWSAFWAEYVRRAAQRQGRKVAVTEMFDPHDLTDPLYNNVIDHGELYDFVEMSQNNHQQGQLHYDRILGVRSRLAGAPRPMTNVKIYGAAGGRFGTDQDGMERFWRNIFAGCASSRFHEKHLGGGKIAARMIRSARTVTDAFDLFHTAPHNDLLLDREPNLAYCLAAPGKEYAVYFPAGGKVRLDARGLDGECEVRWYDIGGGRWANAGRVAPGQPILLTAQSSGQWVALVRSNRKEDAHPHNN